MSRHSILTVICLMPLVASSNVATAQPKPGYLPSSTHIFPAGARRGSQVDVFVGAECTPPGTQLLFHGDGISGSSFLTKQVVRSGEPSPKRIPTITPITYPREWPARLEVAKDAPVGVAFWRLHSAQGGTGSRPFVIGDLPEFIEVESNSTPKHANKIELPVTVNGQIHGERDMDCYRFKLPVGQVVSCEVLAGRLGSNLDPIVELLDDRGVAVAAQQVHIGSDPVLVYQAKSSGDYILRISHVTFRGDPSFVYRVNIRTGAFPRFALPGGVPANATNHPLRVFHVDGRDGKWSQAMVSLTKDSGSVLRARFGFQSPTSLSVDSFPASAEREPNNDLKTANSRSIPFVSYGQFDSAQDQDHIRTKVKKGQRIRASCTAWPLGLPTLPTIQVLASDGSQLTPPAKSVGADLAASLVWTSKTDQDVVLKLQDLRHGSRGAADFAYRLVVQDDTPDFQLKIASDSVVVTQGSASKLTVVAERFGNLNVPIDLTFTGLPEGVTAEATQIPANKTQVSVSLKATESVAVQNVVVRVSGSAKLGEETIQRTAAIRHLGVDEEGVSIESPTTDRLYVSVQHKPLFRLVCSEAYLYAHRGSVFEYEMEAERLNGFDGEIHLQRGDRQNRDMDGVEIWNAKIPAGKNNATVPIYLPETMAINVQSQTQLYSQAWATFDDAAGNQQSVLVLAEKRNMLRTLPTVVKLRSKTSQLEGKPGEIVTCEFELQRTSNFPGPMQLTLLNADWRGEKPASVTIAAGQTEASLRLRIPSQEMTADEPTPLKFRATGVMDGSTIITEASIELTVVD